MTARPSWLAPDAPASELRLHFGEMTANEVNLARAVLGAARLYYEKRCRKCGGAMVQGVATGQTLSGGMPDFPGDAHGITLSPGGPGKVIPAMKCEVCGWSVT